ncbi:MAG TPA: PQQ-binding-like beta-propeller repeat protein [Terriglobia bacterium]|nr:PQQ-binding-like beta-propeller repeat protein [Terriglobia bacterium]
MCLLGSTVLVISAAYSQSQVQAGRKLFEANCALCHGVDAKGGERGPDLTDRGDQGGRSKDAIQRTIRNGRPAAGMPPFKFPENEESALVAYVYSLTAPAAASGISGDAAAGKTFFWGKGQCGSCHMIYGRGGVKGPDLTNLGQERMLSEIELALAHPDVTPGYQVASVRLRDGRALRGFVRNESDDDLELQDFNGAFYFLRAAQIAEIKRETKPLMPAVQLSDDELHNLLAYLIAPSPPKDAPTAAEVAPIAQPGDWPTYNGQPGGNRYSPLDQINAENARKLGARWTFSIPVAGQLEVTPVVAGGLMFVTTGNNVYALDAYSGREVWHYRRNIADRRGGGGINRGVAVLGDKIFVATPDAHLLALNRVTGGLIWDAEVADPQKKYFITSAPLVAGNLVITGVAGGDDGVSSGFVDAYRASDGSHAWRFWTVPKPGTALAQTWIGGALSQGGASTWMTGTYDPVNDLLYWSAGNPCPDFNGDARRGDNLYSDSVLALKPETGELKWYFQFTPHDEHDWDAQETPMLVDAEYHGRRRHLLLQANRNGFFYVFDRITGKLLMATPFVDKLTWASGIGPDGRPKVLPGTAPTPEGNKACPSVEGATNWMSSSWNPITRLFYVETLEKCSIYVKSSLLREPGKPFVEGGGREIPGEPGKKYLRAIDIQTGRRVWEVPQVGPAASWGGVLSTAGGVVFFCDDSGAFAAVDAKTGAPLWHFHTSQNWHASPMTYRVEGKQFVAVAAGSSIIAFGL